MYKVPSIEEIRAIPHNGVKVVSLFAGAGGSSLGYRMLGCKVLVAVEFLEYAANIYKLNSPSTTVLCQDVREIDFTKLGQYGVNVGEIDILDASPPCDQFSMAGDREKNWGKVVDYHGKKQRVDDLSWEFVRAVRELNPRAVIMENVKGLMTGKALGYLKEIIRRVEALGYFVEAKLVNGVQCGLPQKRERVFLLANRIGIKDQWDRPVSGVVSCLEAFGGCESLGPIDADSWIQSPGNMRYWGQCIPGKSAAKSDSCGNGFSLSKIDINFPTLTLTSSPLAHHKDCRFLSIAELKRISSFPDDFDFGDLPYMKAAGRMGQSVPPFMIRHVAGKLVRELAVRK